MLEREAAVLRPGSWPSILCVFLYGVTGASTVSKLIPLGGDLARVFGTTPAQFGWLVSLIALPAALVAIPSGIVVDRFGPRRVLNVSVSLGVLANLVYLVAPASWVMTVARLIEGLAIAHMYTAAPAFLMATTDGKRRAGAMTVWASYMPTGTAVGLLLAGQFAGGANWRHVFVAQGALYLLVGLINLLQPRIVSTQTGTGPSLWHRLLDLRGAYARPQLLLLALAFFLMISLGFGASSSFPSYLARVHQVSIASTSGLVAVATLLMIPGSLGVGALITHGLRQPVVFTGLGIAGALVGSLAFFPYLTIPLRCVVVGLWFMLSGGALATIMATLPVVAEPQRRGAAAALMNQAAATATFVNPPLWLPLAAAAAWWPFAALMSGGWFVAVLCVWGIASFRGPRSET